MDNTKLLQTLKPLRKKDLINFLQFVRSPYFNKHEGVILMVEYLSQIHPDYSAENLQPFKLINYLNSWKTVTINQLSPISSYCLKLLEKFIALEQLQENPILENFLMVEGLKKLGHFKWLNKTLDHIDTKLRQEDIHGSSFFYWKYRHAAELDSFYSKVEVDMKNKSIELKEQFLDRFYLSEKLQDAVEMLQRKRIWGIDFDIQMVEPVLKLIQSNEETYRTEPRIYVYYKLYLLVIEHETAHYFELKNLLAQHERFFSRKELKDIFQGLQNFCIGQSNQGKSEFFEELFEMYKIQLSKGLLMEEGFLSDRHYKNIVTAGVRLKELDWVINFIQQYRAHLLQEEKENAYHFNLAYYYYANYEFDKVLDHLQKVEYKHITYNLDAKMLLMRTYYQLAEYNALLSLCVSVSQYLKRNKSLPDFHRKGYNNLFKLTAQASRLKSDLHLLGKTNAQRELQKLKGAFERAEVVFLKNWVEEKVGELEGEVRDMFGVEGRG